jgi:rubrerythrin
MCERVLFQNLNEFWRGVSEFLNGCSARLLQRSSKSNFLSYISNSMNSATDLHFPGWRQPAVYKKEGPQMYLKQMNFARAGKAVLAAGLVLGFGAGRLWAGTSQAVSIWTVRNCEAALSQERNAAARYRAFARKADEEGYGAVASLFRAAAVAVDVHGNNQDGMIRKLGGTPYARIEDPIVKATRENLEASINQESRANENRMYEGFIEQARRQAYTQVVNMHAQAEESSSDLAKMFSAALGNLDQLKGSQSRTYYVCNICGHISAHLHFEICGRCFHAKKRFMEIS